MSEIWAFINGCDGMYQISSLGRVRNLATGELLKGELNSNGYLRVTIRGRKLLIHREVALAYLKNPCSKKIVHHIDGNKTNNEINNLEWCSSSENLKHAYSDGRRVANNPFGETAHNARLSNSDVRKIKELLREGAKGTEVAKLFRVSKSMISRIKTNKNWSEII